MDVEELELPAKVEVNKKELDVAARLVDALATKFEPGKYKDEYRERVQEVIDKKAKGQEVVVQAPAEEEAPQVINLMEALHAASRTPRRRVMKEGPNGTRGGGNPREQGAGDTRWRPVHHPL